MNVDTILYIINSRTFAGVEKRFGYLFSYITKKRNSNIKFIVLINKILFEDLNTLFYYHNTPEVRFITYGIKEIKIFSKVIPVRLLKILDDLFLFVSIVKIKLSKVKINLVHFINTRSLRTFFLFKNENKITSFYNGGSTSEGVKGKAYKKIFKRNVFIDCLSEDIRTIIINESKNPPEPQKVYVSPCSFINYENTNVDFHSKENIISFVGRLTQDKGLILLMEVLKELCYSIPQYKIYILGKGPLDSKLNTYINQNGLEKMIFTGFIPDPKIILKKSKIFLSLQKNENYPSQALLEAMACKNAIIATDVGLTRDLVNCERGILIENNSSALLKAILVLANNENKIKFMGENAREFVLKHHTVEKYYEYLIHLYNNIIN